MNQMTIRKGRRLGRSLTDPEIRAFWRGCQQIGYPFGPTCQLMLLTAGRRSEVAYMPTDELDRGEKVWLLSRSRYMSQQPHVVPLTDLALEIIDGLPEPVDNGYLFMAPPKGTTDRQFVRSKKKLDRLMLTHLKREGRIAGDGELEPWVMHDLRRTARTNFARLGVDDHVSARLLNHQPHRLWETFLQRDDLGAKRQALEKWCALVQEIVA